jgi:hypothetical protein
MVKGGGFAVPSRKPGKYGALPRNFSAPGLTFEHYLTSVKALPDSPMFADRITKATGFSMYLNDQLGDCTDAGMLNGVCAMTAFSGRVAGGAVFDNSVPLRMYEATGGYVDGDPSTDNGATLQSVAQYMVSTGVTDTRGNLHKLAAWANVGDPTNLPLLKKVLNTFGTVYCAFDIPQSAETQFAGHNIWSPVAGSPVVGGHCIPLQYSAVGDPGTTHRAETFVTWGSEQPATMAWVSQQITEAMVLVSSDWIDRNGTTIEGLNMAALLQDMSYV